MKRTHVTNAVTILVLLLSAKAWAEEKEPWADPVAWNQGLRKVLKGRGFTEFAKIFQRAAPSTRSHFPVIPSKEWMAAHPDDKAAAAARAFGEELWPQLRQAASELRKRDVAKKELEKGLELLCDFRQVLMGRPGYGNLVMAVHIESVVVPVSSENVVAGRLSPDTVVRLLCRKSLPEPDVVTFAACYNQEVGKPVLDVAELEKYRWEFAAEAFLKVLGPKSKDLLRAALTVNEEKLWTKRQFAELFCIGSHLHWEGTSAATGLSLCLAMGKPMPDDFRALAKGFEVVLLPCLERNPSYKGDAMSYFAFADNVMGLYQDAKDRLKPEKREN
jgi:hypothetical protein